MYAPSFNVHFAQLHKHYNTATPGNKKLSVFHTQKRNNIENENENKQKEELSEASFQTLLVGPRLSRLGSIPMLSATPLGTTV